MNERKRDSLTVDGIEEKKKALGECLVEGE